MKSIFKIFIVTTILVVIFGCSVDQKMEYSPAQSLEELEIPEGFDWDFTKDVDVVLTAHSPAGNPVQGVEISLYKTQNNLVFNLPTNEAGELSTTISMPESANSVILEYDGNQVTVPVWANTITYDMTVNPVRNVRDGGTVVYPSDNSVITLMFEDFWPSKGDFDFNDMVLETSGELVYVDDVISSIEISTTLVASGARFNNGFKMLFNTTAFPFNENDVITYSASSNGIPVATTSQMMHDALGTNVSWYVVTGLLEFTFFDNAFDVYHPSSGVFGINTDSNAAWTDPITITITIDYDTEYAYVPGTPSFDFLNMNPFIVVDEVIGHEIHLPGYDYSPAFSWSAMFGTGNDSTDPNDYAATAFTTASGFSWGLKLEGVLEYPIEKVDVILAYPALQNYFDNVEGGEIWWQPHPDDDHSEGNIYSRGDMGPNEQNAPLVP